MNTSQRDRGSATTEYAAGVVLVAAIGVVLLTSDVGPQIGDAFTGTTCRISQSCDPAPPVPPPGDPGPGRSQPGAPDPTGQPQHGWPDPTGRPQPGQPDPRGLPQHGWPDEQGPPPVEEVPAERKFNAAVDAYDAAQQNYQDAQGDFEDLEGEMRVWHPVSRSAPDTCAQTGSVVDCMDVGTGLTPHGAAWRRLSGIPKATRMLNKYQDLLERVRDAREDRDTTAGDLRRICGRIEGGSGTVSCGNPINKRWASVASFPERDLQRKYDEHASDFGLPPTYSGDNSEALQEKIRDHIAAPATRRYKVDHQGRMGIVFLDRKTGRLVMLRPDHSLWDTRILRPTQFGDVAAGRLPAG